MGYKMILDLKADTISSTTIYVCCYYHYHYPLVLQPGLPEPPSSNLLGPELHPVRTLGQKTIQATSSKETLEKTALLNAPSIRYWNGKKIS